MTTTYLEVAYMAPYGWCHPLLRALQEDPKLRAKHQEWRSHKLSDLAVAIQGRLDGLRHLVRFIDEQLSALGRRLEEDGPNVTAHVAGGYAYVFEGVQEEAVQRALVGISSFVREARSCFENLA